MVERHGALFKMAFEKACSLEAPTTELEVNELIDFTFAQNSIDAWDVVDFRPVSEFLDDNFDFRRAYSKTISLTPT